MALARPDWITLGTAALGMDYGVIAPTKRPGDATVQVLFDRAWTLGVRSIDTARGYGDAEGRIGVWCRRSGHAPFIVTKIPALPDQSNAAFIKRSLQASFVALGVERVELCLLHRAGDLLRPGVAEQLRVLTSEGLIGGFGVSAYEMDEIEAALDVEGVAALQAPASLLDRRLIDGGLFARARAQGVLVFARSVFLQGALFVAPDQLQPFLRPLAPTLARLKALVEREGLSLAALSLASLRASGEIDSLVIGATSAEEIEANVRFSNVPIDSAIIEEACAAVNIDQLSLLDPRHWPAPVVIS